MSESDSAGDRLRQSAMGVLREVAGQLDLEGVKSTLDSIEAAAREHELTAEVTSAVPLTDEERRVLESRLRARHGDKLTVRYEIEPAILGGLIVRVGDRYLDGSVAGRLGQLKQTLHGAR